MVYSWSVKQLMSIARHSWMILVTITLITQLVLGPLVGWHRLVPWTVLLLGLAFSLAAIAFKYDRASAALTDKNIRFARLHNLLVGLIGITWGAGIFWVRDHESAAIIYVFVLSGTALGAVSSQHSYLPSCLTSIWTSIAPVVILILSGSISGLPPPLGILVALYGVMLTIIARKMNNFMFQQVNLTRELQQQVNQLSESSEQLKEARKAADRANRVKSELLSQVSHDIRHPLFGIGLLVGALAHSQSDQDRQDIIKRIEQSIAGLNRIFSLLLEKDRLDRGEMPVNKKCVRVSSIIESVVSSLPSTGLKPTIQTVNSSLWVHTDPLLLKTVIQNIADNAQKYADDGGILIGCRRQDGQVAIWICDQGPGIPEHQLDFIFKPFKRLNPKDLSKGDGIGLGLSIARRLAILLGLNLRVKSSLRQGTIFKIEGLIVVPDPSE